MDRILLLLRPDCGMVGVRIEGMEMETWQFDEVADRL
jgi:hypothetical protein